MNNYLEHHGVKGQKWGILRYRNKDGSLTPEEKRRQASNNSKHRKFPTIAKAKVEKHRRHSSLKKVRGLSDEELKTRIERLALEQKYKDAVKKDISPGKKAVADVLSSSGKKALGVAATGAMVYGVRYAMTKKFDWDEAASYIAPNPNKKK